MTKMTLEKRINKSFYFKKMTKITLEKRINMWLKTTSEELDISGLKLTEWPKELAGKDHLIVISDLSWNQLKSLPKLPNLTKLDCDRNQLKSLPNFPKLTELWCSHNKLKSLSNYPNLTELSCTGNQLFSNDLNDWRKMWKNTKTS